MLSIIMVSALILSRLVGSTAKFQPRCSAEITAAFIAGAGRVGGRLLSGYRETLLLDSTDNAFRRLRANTHQRNSSGEQQIQPEPMSNLYQEWTIDQDRLLFENRRESLPRLASMLGRGLRGVEARLDKLTDVDSTAYARLFVGESSGDGAKKAGKLTPAKEVLRRIRWDGTLDPQDFAVLYYDRVEEKIVETPFDAANDSVQTNEEMFVFALPEHRIVAVKFKERVVWDKEKRLDCVFGSMNGNGETIEAVIENYVKWKQEKEEMEEINRKRQAEVAEKVKIVLGDESFGLLKDLSSGLQHSSGSLLTPTEADVEQYVKSSLGLFQSAREEVSHIPQTDLESLELLSELVALLPDDDLRVSILSNIESTVDRLAGRGRKGNAKSSAPRELPELKEDELSEQFVRGSGAGGQKINKTSNRVILVHKPTQLRVECQDTRSLGQNRKIARKRLRLKLDEYLNGDQSRTRMKVAKAANKKVKAKARNKARQKRKKEAAAEEA